MALAVAPARAASARALPSTGALPLVTARSPALCPSVRVTSKRFQSTSSNRFTHSTARRPGGSAAAARRGAAAGSPSPPSQTPLGAEDINAVTPVTTVARLKAVLHDAESAAAAVTSPATAQRGGDPLPKWAPLPAAAFADQQTENRRQRCLRQLLCFSPASLHPAERRSLTIGLVLQTLRTLLLYTDDVAWRETALVRELGHWLHDNIAREAASCRSAVATTGSADAADTQAGGLARRYGACIAAVGVLGYNGVGALLCELVSACHSILELTKGPGARSGGGTLLLPSSLDNSTCDELLACAEAAAVNSGRGATVLTLAPTQGLNASRQPLDGRLVQLVLALRERLERRLDRRARGSVEYTNPREAVRVLDAMASWAVVRAPLHCTQGSATDVPSGDGKTPLGGGRASSSQRQRRTDVEALHPVEWQSLVHRLMDYLCGQEVLSSSTLSIVDVCRLLRDAVELVPSTSECITTLLTHLNSSAEALSAHGEGTPSPMTALSELVRLCGDEALAQRLGGGDTAAAELLSQLGRRVEELARSWLSRTQVSTLAVGELAALADVYAGVQGHADDGATAGSQDPSLANLLQAQLVERVAALGAHPELAAQFSPRAGAVTLHLLLSSPVPERVQAGHAFLTALYSHVRSEFNRGRKVFPADLLCLFEEEVLSTPRTVTRDGAAAAAATEAPFVQELSFAVAANMDKWSATEMFLFLQHLANLSAALQKPSSGRGEANARASETEPRCAVNDGVNATDAEVQAAARLAAATLPSARRAVVRKAVNRLLRESATRLAPYVNSPRSAVSGADAGTAGAPGSSNGEGLDDSARRHAGRDATAPAPPAASGFVFLPAEVLTLLDIFTTARVRSDEFLTGVTTVFGPLYRQAARDVCVSPPAASPAESRMADGRATQKDDDAAERPRVAPLAAGGPAEGRAPTPGQAVQLSDGQNDVTSLPAVAGVLAAFAVLEFKNTNIFLDASSLVLARLQALPVSVDRTLADAVTRVLASYAKLIVWNYPVIAALTRVVKQTLSAQGPARLDGSFTDEQLTAVQLSLLRMNAQDKDLTGMFLARVEARVAANGGSAARVVLESPLPSDTRVSREINGRDSSANASLRTVALLSVLSRLAVALRDEQENYSARQLHHTERSLPVQTFSSFTYVASREPLQVRIAEVCAALADRLFLHEFATQNKTTQSHVGAATVATDNLSLNANVVGELLISLARVSLFSHPLFLKLRQESLSAVLQASPQCLSQMLCAIALDAVVQDAHPAGKVPDASSAPRMDSAESAASHSEIDHAPDHQPANDRGRAACRSFHREFFSLAADTVRRFVRNDSVSAAALSHMLYSFTIARHRDDDLLITVLPKMKLLTFYGSFREVTEAFYSYSTNTIWHQRLFARLADRIILLIRNENIVHRRDLLLILESLEHVGFRYDKLFETVAVRTLPVLHLYALTDVTRAVHCLSSLGYVATAVPTPAEETLRTGEEGGAGLAEPVRQQQTRKPAPEKSVYDMFYACCCDRVVDLLRLESQEGRADLMKLDSAMKAQLRQFLSDLLNADVTHDTLCGEMRLYFPDLASEFSKLDSTRNA